MGPIEMMTSDMTPDENGNFKRQSLKEDNYNHFQVQEIVKEIANRNSKIDENSKINSVIDNEKTLEKQNSFEEPKNFEKHNLHEINEERDLLTDPDIRICKSFFESRH